MFKSHSWSTRSHRWNVKTFSFETREIERTTSCKKEEGKKEKKNILSYPIEKGGMNPKKKKWRREIKMEAKGGRGKER